MEGKKIIILDNSNLTVTIVELSPKFMTKHNNDLGEAVEAVFDEDAWMY